MLRPQRRLLVLPAAFRIDHFPDSRWPSDEAWIAVVRAPEGLTVVREFDPHVSSDVERWAGLYGDDAHDLDVPGMLDAVIGPLAHEGLTVFVASTFYSDLILVNYDELPTATAILERAGHRVSPRAR